MLWFYDVQHHIHGGMGWQCCSWWQPQEVALPGVFIFLAVVNHSAAPFGKEFLNKKQNNDIYSAFNKADVFRLLRLTFLKTDGADLTRSHLIA